MGNVQMNQLQVGVVTSWDTVSHFFSVNVYKLNKKKKKGPTTENVKWLNNDAVRGKERMLNMKGNQLKNIWVWLLKSNNQ